MKLKTSISVLAGCLVIFLFIIADKLSRKSINILFYISVIFLFIIVIFFSSKIIYDFYNSTENEAIYRLSVWRDSAIFLNHEIDKFTNETLLPEMKKTYPKSSIKKHIIGEITGFDRVSNSEACEFVSSITGDNSREVVSFGTEAGLFQEIGISTVVCGPGSIKQAHKIDEFIKLNEIKKCISFLDGIKNKSLN